MIKIDDFKFNRRGKDRIKTMLNAQYFIKKQSAQYLECKVVNLSRTGAVVSVPIDEKLECGAITFIDIYIPKTLQAVSVQAVIKRVERHDRAMLGAVKFTELISQPMFEQLTH